MPVAKHSTHYNMKHPRRGFAIIFNHEVFEYGSLKPRSGTMEDANRLVQCLKDLQFEVYLYQDLKKDDLENVIESGELFFVSFHLINWLISSLSVNIIVKSVLSIFNLLHFFFGLLIISVL